MANRNMSLEKVKMPEQDPNVRNKNFDEVALGYTPEMESSLERERQEYATAYRKWVSEHGISPNTGTVHQNISNPIRQIQL